MRLSNGSSFLQLVDIETGVASLRHTQQVASQFGPAAGIFFAAARASQGEAPHG
jgi:hypothetical protein